MDKNMEITEEAVMKSQSNSYTFRLIKEEMEVELFNK